MFVTAFVARLDLATGELDYVNAGHNPPILVRKDGGVETLSDGGLVLGLFENIVYDGIPETIEFSLPLEVR